MKKLILTVTILLGSSLLFAKKHTNLIYEIPKTLTQEQYTEINAKDLPLAVITAMNEVYPDAVILNTYVNSNKEYKIAVTLAKRTVVYNLFIDNAGEWIKKY